MCHTCCVQRQSPFYSFGNKMTKSNPQILAYVGFYVYINADYRKHFVCTSYVAYFLENYGIILFLSAQNRVQKEGSEFHNERCSLFTSCVIDFTK